MPSKRTVILVFSGIILIWLFSFVMHLYETQDKFKIENISYDKIKFIEIDNRGIIGDKEIVIRNKNSIDKTSRILKNSKEVKWENLNLKANMGLCELYLHRTDGSVMELILYNLPPSGGIVSSGDYYYKNDELLNFAIGILKSADKSKSNPAP